MIPIVVGVPFPSPILPLAYAGPAGNAVLRGRPRVGRVGNLELTKRQLTTTDLVPLLRALFASPSASPLHSYCTYRSLSLHRTYVRTGERSSPRDLGLVELSTETSVALTQLECTELARASPRICIIDRTPGGEARARFPARTPRLHNPINDGTPKQACMPYPDQLPLSADRLERLRVHVSGAA